MKSLYLPAWHPAHPRQPLVARLFLLVLLLALGLGRAQGQGQAPPWELAVASTGGQPGQAIPALYAAATDAAGNVYVTGSFVGSITIGTTTLVATGPLANPDVFVAKWDATAQFFTWATSGGGQGNDVGLGIAVAGRSVYVTGYLTSGSGAVLAGQALPGAGAVDMFVAKFIDTSTGHTPATSSYANGWATSGGGGNIDIGSAIAVRGNDVFVAGTFVSNSRAVLAGQVLAGAGNTDMFVAKFIDTSTGSTPATSSFANGWAVSGGGTGADEARGLAVSGAGVFVTGSYTPGPGARIAGQLVSGQVATAGNLPDFYLAKFIDTSTGSTPATSSFANGWAIGEDNPLTSEYGYGVAVSGTGVFVTGFFGGGTSTLAGQPLTSRGDQDIFVAKYIDTSTGSTPATSSFANGWATSDGGSRADRAFSIAVRGRAVLVTGQFGTGSAARFAGQALTEAGGADVFVAKYVDTSTGSTPATSSFANGWATSAGGVGFDTGACLAINGQQVYVGGGYAPPAAFGPITLPGPTATGLVFLARLTDATLPLATATAATVRPGLTLFPNPARDAVQVRGAAPGTTLAVHDALGRLRATAPADASGAARVSLAGLPPGVYVLRGAGQAQRLLVE